MNIFGQGWNPFSHLDNQTGKTGSETMRMQNVAPVSGNAQTVNGTALSALQTGHIFSGEILNITSQDVTILLNNQQVINAKLGETMELNIGQNMFFEVSDHQGEQIFIRPVPDLNVDGQSLAAEKALSANGFAFTERNMQIANHLMEAGMPLDRESMRKVMQQAVNFPETDVKQLIAMNRLGLPVTETNLKQFAFYTTHEHQLTQAMTQTLDGLESALQTLGETADTAQMTAVNQQIMEIFGWGQTDASLQGDGQRLPSTEQAFQPAAEELLQNDSETVLSATPKSVDQTDLTLLQTVRDSLLTMGFPEETVQEWTQGTPDYGELLANVSRYLEQGSLPETVTREFFQSETYRKLLKKGVEDEWLMKPDAMKEPKEIDQIYEKIYRQSAQLEGSFQSAGQSGQQYSEHAQNMRENIQFMQQLNQQFIFAQLPMKMNGQEANSELFVYANKKKIQQGADGVKVLLHLDMPHLGGTDILVRLKDRMLHASFTLEDQESVSVVASNMRDLTEQLESKGFRFTNEVKRAERKPSDSHAGDNIPPDAVVEEMLNQDLVTGIKRYTFDMRT